MRVSYTVFFKYLNKKKSKHNKSGDRRDQRTSLPRSISGLYMQCPDIYVKVASTHVTSASTERTIFAELMVLTLKYFCRFQSRSCRTSEQLIRFRLLPHTSQGYLQALRLSSVVNPSGEWRFYSQMPSNTITLTY
ncbi:hypothetical protein CDAR_121271 [Caerostris darwini]|uniref:Uncharacterized protein n=1 Tax=Caerostris darwini TaxID=1538125 RepID=A0AAV4VH07_9ARAC|nr:hypothetical protein CDAR_121271 [Caerostris darwini]